MRNYPRKTNRFVLFVLGVLIWVLAVLLLCFHYVPSVKTFWEKSFTSLANIEMLWLPFSSHSQVGPILIIMMVLVLIISFVCLNLIVSQGGGKQNRIMKVIHGEEEALSIAQVSFIEDLLKQKLANPQLVHSISVSAWKIRKHVALRVDVVLKQGADPVEVRPILDKAVADMDSLFGTAVPILVHLSRPWLERKAARIS